MDYFYIKQMASILMFECNIQTYSGLRTVGISNEDCHFVSRAYWKTQVSSQATILFYIRLDSTKNLAKLKVFL